MIKDYLRAGYPLIAVRSVEPIRAAFEVAQSGNGRRVFQWDCVRGYQVVGESRWNECDPYGVTQAALEAGPNALWILKNYHFWFKEPTVIQSIQNSLPVFKEKAITLVTVGPDIDLPAELARETLVKDFSLPDRGALRGVLMALAGQKNVNIQVSEAEAEKIVDAIQGLTMAEAQDALAYCLVREKSFNPSVLVELKAQLVERGGALQYSRFKETFENLGGLENLKAWTINRFTRRRDGLPFRGVLLLGVPGTGKSHFAKALGNQINWPVLLLDMGRIFGSLVGESESKMRETLKTIDAMAPCVLFLDELEKGLAGTGTGGVSGDSGTTQRVGGTFLTWLQDHESLVWVVATCNDIRSLAAASDGAYVRAGRWDNIFFVDLPNDTERRQILDIYTRQFLGKEVADYQKSELPDLQGYSGAEIRQVAIEAAYGDGDLQLAAKMVIPLSKSNSEAINNLRNWAAGRTLAASLPEVDGKAADSGPVNPYDFYREVSFNQ
jgi:hypothetical protein